MAGAVLTGNRLVFIKSLFPDFCDDVDTLDIPAATRRPADGFCLEIPDAFGIFEYIDNRAGNGTYEIAMKKIIEYTVSLIKGLGVTLKYLCRPAVTLQYPKQRWTPPERYRGRVALRPKKCISCQMCARACPNNCLEVKFNVGDDKKRKLTEFVYHIDTCLFCGLCAEPCPTSAIFMNHDYELAVCDRKDLIVDLVKVDSYVE